MQYSKKNFDMKNKRLNWYWSTTGISIGITIDRPHKCTGWNWFIGIDLLFLSVWVYL